MFSRKLFGDLVDVVVSAVDLLSCRRADGLLDEGTNVAGVVTVLELGKIRRRVRFQALHFGQTLHRVIRVLRLRAARKRERSQLIIRAVVIGDVGIMALFSTYITLVGILKPTV